MLTDKSYSMFMFFKPLLQTPQEVVVSQTWSNKPFLCPSLLVTVIFPLVSVVLPRNILLNLKIKYLFSLT